MPAGIDHALCSGCTQAGSRELLRDLISRWHDEDILRRSQSSAYLESARDRMTYEPDFRIRPIGPCQHSTTV
jgi:hypothetical protein